jgi:outer membrane protein OmpA-like peptidoglycan-associated protein
MSGRLVAALLLGTVVLGCAGRSATTKGVPSGTEMGAAADAALGGSYVDRQKRDMEKVLTYQDRLQRDGDTLRVSLSTDILFESGSARLQPGADTKLSQIAEVLQRYPRTSVELTGHTDNRGSERFNQEISEQRAGTIRDALVTSGVDPSRVSTGGDGEHRPVATNSTATGRAANRRVDLTIRPDEDLAREQRGSGEAPPPPTDESR